MKFWFFVIGLFLFVSIPAFCQVNLSVPSDISQIFQSTAEMKEYTRLSITHFLLSTFWHIAILLIFLQSGLASRLSLLVLKDSNSVVLRTVCYSIFLLLFTFVLSLPLNIWGDFYLDKSFGLTPEVLSAFLYRKVLSSLVSGVFAILVISIAVLIVNYFPRRWGILLGLFFATLTTFQSLLAPYYFEQNSSDLKPLDRPALSARINRLLRKADLEHVKVFVEKVSDHTYKLDGYVAGAGPSTCFVLYDTVLKALSDDEIEALIAHEISHIELGHLTRNVYETMLLFLFAPMILQLLMPYLIRIAPSKWALKDAKDLTVIPTVWLLFCISWLMILPIRNYNSRNFERQADSRAITLTEQPEGFMLELATFARANLNDFDPPPWAVSLFYSHPSPRERIEAAIKRAKQ